MKTVYFPTDAPEKPPFGSMFDFPDEFDSLQQAFDSGIPHFIFWHGVGVEDTGNGTLNELKQYHNMAMFNNGFNQSVDSQKNIICRMQSPTGLYRLNEMPWFIAKCKSYKPKRKPAMMGFSGGAFGTINNVTADKVDAAEYSGVWLLSAGGAGSKSNPNPPIGGTFAAKLKAAGVKLYLIHNENDTIARVEQSQFLFDSAKSVGLPVIFVRYKKVWQSSDGSTTSHGSVGYVFPSWQWRMYSTDPNGVPGKNFAEVTNANGNGLPCYNFYARFKDDLPALPVEPIPIPDKLIATMQVWERADGSKYTIFI